MIIEPDPKRIERRIVPLFESMGRAAAGLCERYTAQELTVILDFAVRSRAMAEEEKRASCERKTRQLHHEGHGRREVEAVTIEAGGHHVNASPWNQAKSA